LSDGRIFPDVLIVGGTITDVRGYDDIHFQRIRFLISPSHIENGRFADEGS